MSRFRPHSSIGPGAGVSLTVVVFALALAGCGSSSKPSTAAQVSPTPATTATTAPTTTTTQTPPKRAAKKHAATKKKHKPAAKPAASTTPKKTTTTKTITTTKTTPKPKPAPGVSVDLRSSKLGMILVGPTGRTLYLFVKDKGTSSTCYGSCASVWPPLATTGIPQAGAGVHASLLGTTKRTDGTTEVTYDGHPLYYYVGDTSPGKTTGQALNQFGAPWYVLAASGSAITRSS